MPTNLTNARMFLVATINPDLSFIITVSSSDFFSPCVHFIGVCVIFWIYLLHKCPLTPRLGLEPSVNLFFLYFNLQPLVVDSALFMSVRARLRKRLIEIATSKAHEWRDKWCWAYGPLFWYRNAPWRTSLPKLSRKEELVRILSDAESSLVRVLEKRLERGEIWSVSQRLSLSMLQLTGVVKESFDSKSSDSELPSSSVSPKWNKGIPSPLAWGLVT